MSLLIRPLSSSTFRRCTSSLQHTANKSIQCRCTYLNHHRSLIKTNNSSCRRRLFSTNSHGGNIDSTSSSIEAQLAALQSEVAQLSYLIKQTSAQQVETTTLSRRAEARAYIIEHKLLDIQSHVVKIPALENMAQRLRQLLEKLNMPSAIAVSDAFERAGGRELLLNKYTFWGFIGAGLLFWQYRVAMYKRTSEEVADIASMTLQQDTLRMTIQETLATVANSPSTLSSLSLLFQQLISEERTQQHLIDLIVRALGSEGVRLAAIRLLDVCFQNEDLQLRAGEFLKVAAKTAVLDEKLQQSAGVGIQKALKSAVLPQNWWAKSLNAGDSDGGGEEMNDGEVADVVESEQEDDDKVAEVPGKDTAVTM